MRWQDFIEDGIVKKTNKDIGKIKSLIKMSDNSLLFLSKLKIDRISSSTILANYYEALRQIVEAIAISKHLNAYSHEAFTCFLAEILKEDLISRKFDRFRKLRNGVNYYGKQIDVETSKEAKTEILNLIKTLRNKYLK